MKKRRNSKIRVGRLLIVLVLFVIIIFSAVFGTIFVNYSIKHNSIKENNSVKIISSKLKLWDKTIKLIKSNKKDITIYKDNYAITLDYKDIKNNMVINLNVTDKKVDRALFDNVKSVYIKNNSLLKNAKKIKVKLPSYLMNKGIVDIYGITEDNEAVLIKSNVKTSKYVTINIDKKYKDYFVTYVKVKNINIKNIEDIYVGDEVSIEVSYVPSNVTNKKIDYKVYDNNILDIKDGVIEAKKDGKTKIKITSSDGPNAIIEIEVKKAEEKFDPTKTRNGFKIEVIDGITYIDGILIANKTYGLPSSYNPGGMKDEYMEAFYEMQAAAALDGYSLFIASGYRSYDFQTDLYNYYVRIDGKEAADTYSARPGHSEHQTGLAADINAADDWFNDTAEAAWMKENCYKYGFIVRYPAGKQDITGYVYESWHLRYVGKELSQKLHDLGNPTLEEYFGIDSKYEE